MSDIEHLRSLIEGLRADVNAQLAQSAERDRAVAKALDSLTGQLNQFTSALADQLRRSADDITTQANAELGEAAAAVRDAGRFAERLAALDAIRAGVDQLMAWPAATAEEVEQLAHRAGPLELASLRAQLDAVGRLVHHVVRSVHLIEAATVGVSPRLERDRAAAAAALEELRASAAEPASDGS